MALEIDRVTREPDMTPLARAFAPPAAPPPGSREPLLIAADPEGADVAGVSAALAPLIELIVSNETQTPFRVGLIGPSGVGKSFALHRLSQTISELGARNPGGGVSRPREIVVAKLDAAGLAAEGFDPASALASAVFVALEAGRDGANYAGLADEAAHGAGDPRRAATAATERQDELSRRLDAERATREELASKRARLGEALIYDTPGSRVDAMIRSRRGAIEARLRRFGYTGDDLTQTFRDLLFDHAGAGAGSRFGLFFRSIWAFRGQVTLLLVAVVAVLAALGLDRLRVAAAAGALDSLFSSVPQVPQFLVAHDDWLQRGGTALLAIAVLAVFFNLWRATGFSALLIRGLRLLNFDIRERRTELDSSLSRLERRIATLTSEAQAAQQRAEALLQRAGGASPLSRGPGPGFLAALQSPAKASRDFLHELGRLMSPMTETGPRPKRIVIVIDNLETLPAAAALRLLEAVGALIGPGMAALIACDPARLSPEAPRRVARDRFDVVFNLSHFGEPDSARLAARLIAEGGRPGVSTQVVATKSIAEPLSTAETAVLAAAAALTDGGPAALKRFYNAYRLARASQAPRGLVAIMIAALQSSREVYLDAIETALARSGDRFETPVEPPELSDAFAAAAGASEERFDKATARGALASARLWTATSR